MVSQVSVMPKRSMLLLATRSERAGALSRMERALTVPRRRPHTQGPGLRVTYPVSKRSKEKSKPSWTLGGGRIFLVQQRERDGAGSKDGERVRDIASVLL